ncbi:hypothetical protein RQP46_004178 [Phenoliferia psychrophenolica]
MSTNHYDTTKRFRSLVLHKDFQVPVLLPALVTSLEAYTSQSKSRTHAFILSFTVDPAADPFDPVSYFVFEGAKVIPFAQAARDYKAQGSDSPPTQAGIARAKEPTPPGGQAVLFFIAELKLKSIGMDDSGCWGALGWNKSIGFTVDRIQKDWLGQLKAGVAKLRQNHIMLRELRLETVRKSEWAHCRHCLEDSANHEETVALSDPHQSQDVAALRAFSNALKPDIGAALYTVYKILTPRPLLNTHILTITVRRLPSISDPSLAFEIVDTLLLALDDLSSDGPLSRFETIIGYSLKDTIESLVKNSQEFPKPRQHQAHVLMFDETSKLVFGLPLSLMDVSTFPLKADDHYERKVVFGVLGEKEDWEEMLRRRAKVSAVAMKEGVVPEMTLREYDRWKDGFLGI